MDDILDMSRTGRQGSEHTQNHLEEVALINQSMPLDSTDDAHHTNTVKRTSKMAKSVFLAFVVGAGVFFTVQTAVYSSRARDVTWGPNEESVVRSNNWFGLSMYTGLRRHHQNNVFFCPFSVSAALTMTMLGADGNTADEIFNVLHFDNRLTRETLHQSFQILLSELVSPDTSDYVLSLANRMFIQQNFPILNKFRQDTKTYYGASSQNVDFYSDTEGARNIINDWVQDVTQDKIRDLLKPDVLTDITRMVLVNAIYFKGDWKSQFDEKSTTKQRFYVNERDSVEIDMMYQKGHFFNGYDQNAKAQVIEIPYSGGELTMVIALPMERAGLQLMEDKLAGDVSLLSKNLHNTSVEVSLPKFQLTDEHDLVELLKNMGIRDLFSDVDADLSQVTGTKDLYISHVVHKAFIEVNEQGSEASAATSVVAVGRMSRAAQFRADHPFYFFIRHERTGSIVFIGRYVQPNGDRTGRNNREDL